MKIRLKSCCISPIVAATVGALVTGQLRAQTFTVLHSFTPPNNNALGIYTNSDGISPNGLILQGTTLYGTTQNGGDSGNGTVFKVNTDGTGFTNLHVFTTLNLNSSIKWSNADGANPTGGLILSGDTLYGTASWGGIGGSGTVFALGTDGTGFTVLHGFTATAGSGGFYYPFGTNSDGAYPNGLTQSSRTLYGTARSGGSYGSGALFTLKVDGTEFTNLHDFTATWTNSLGSYTNSDGAVPTGLIVSANTLYGATLDAGVEGWGTVFAINTDGTRITNLYNLSNSIGRPGPILSGSTLYWTEYQWDYSPGDYSRAVGGLFALKTDGTGLTNLFSTSFPVQDDFSIGGVFLFGETLYWTESLVNWNSSASDWLFAVNTNGTGSGLVYGPAYAVNAEVFSSFGNKFYGTTSGDTSYRTRSGGMTSGNDAIFSLSFTPRLTIGCSGSNITLSWPTNYVGFDYSGYYLRSTTNLDAPAWATNLPAPVVINGENTVTSLVSETQRFFRLCQ